MECPLDPPPSFSLSASARVPPISALARGAPPMPSLSTSAHATPKVLSNSNSSLLQAESLYFRVFSMAESQSSNSSSSSSLNGGVGDKEG